MIKGIILMWFVITHYPKCMMLRRPFPTTLSTGCHAFTILIMTMKMIRWHSFCIEENIGYFFWKTTILEISTDHWFRNLLATSFPKLACKMAEWRDSFVAKLVLPRPSPGTHCNHWVSINFVLANFWEPASSALEYTGIHRRRDGYYSVPSR